MGIRFGVSLGPFYGSASMPTLGVGRGIGALFLWSLQLSFWLLKLTALFCWWTLKLTVLFYWQMLKLLRIAGVWLAAATSRSRQQRRESYERQRCEAEAAAQREHAQLLASLHPEDVDFMRTNGWQAPAMSADLSEDRVA